MQTISPPTILVVEDEILIRMGVAEYLRDCGYRVLEAGDAAEAVIVVQAEPVDLVFTDVDMRGPMDGFGLARWIRANHANIRVIIASGVPRIAERAADLCEGGPLLQKPYPSEALAQRIGALLAMAQQRRDAGEAGG